MSIFHRLKAAFRTLVHGRPRNSWFVPRTRFDYAREVGDGLSSSVVMGVVLWIMRNFPEAPVMLVQDDEPIHDHPMIQLIRRPNPFYSGVVLSMATALSFTTAGNAYWIKERDRQLRVISLWWVPHWMIKPAVESGSGRYIDKYIYTVGGRQYEYDVDDIVHLRFGLDPYDTRLGLAPLQTLLREIFTDDEAANWTAMICKNAGIPGVIISPEEGGLLGDQELEEAKKYIKEMYVGDRRGEPLVNRAPTKVEQFGFNPQEMNLEAIRAIPESRVSAVLGIPAAVVGFMAGLKMTKVGATMKELREQAYEGGIIPLQHMIAEDLWAQLLPDFEPRPELWKVGYDLTKVRVLQEDENKRAERTGKLYTDGVIYLDEARQAEGYETTPAEHIRRVPFNVIEVPAGMPEPQKRMQKMGAKADRPTWAAGLIARFTDDQAKLEKQFASALRKRFDDLGEILAEAYLSEMETRQVAGRNGQRKDLLDEIVGTLIIDQLSDVIDATKILGYGPHFLRVASQTVDSLNALLSLNVMLSETMESKVLSAAGKRQGLIDLTAQTKKGLFDAMTIGRELGEGPPQIAVRIRDLVPAGPWSSAEVRAEVIARTETKYAQNISSLQAYKEADSIGAVQVLDALADNPCDYCIALDGAIVSFEDAEMLADDEHPRGTRDFAPYFGTPDHFDEVVSREAWEASRAAD